MKMCKDEKTQILLHVKAKSHCEKGVDLRVDCGHWDTAPGEGG